MTALDSAVITAIVVVVLLIAYFRWQRHQDAKKAIAFISHQFYPLRKTVPELVRVVSYGDIKEGGRIVDVACAVDDFDEVISMQKFCVPFLPSLSSKQLRAFVDAHVAISHLRSAACSMLESKDVSDGDAACHVYGPKIMSSLAVLSSDDPGV